MRRTLMLAGLALALVATGLLSGCTDSDGPQGKIEDALISYGDRVKSSTFIGSLTVDLGAMASTSGIIPAMNMSGKIDNAVRDRPRMNVTTKVTDPSTNQGTQFTMTIDGVNTYIEYQGKAYVLDNADAGTAGSADIAGLLRDASSVLKNHRKTDTSTVDGVSVTNYTADLDPANFAKLLGRARELTGPGNGESFPLGPGFEQMVSSLIGKSQAQFGIDANGILRRGALIMRIQNPIDPKASVKIVFSGEVHDVNEPVEIFVPTRAERLDSAEALQGLLGDSPATPAF